MQGFQFICDTSSSHRFILHYRISFIGGTFQCSALISMAGYTCGIMTNENNIVILGGFKNHSFIGKGRQHMVIDAPAGEIGKGFPGI